MSDMTTPQATGYGATGVGLIGSALSAVAQYQKGQLEKGAYEYNAAVALQQMREQLQDTETKYQTLIGKQASLYGKAGVSLTSGSPLLIMATTAAKGGLEAERIREGGTEEAALQEYYGKMAAWTGTMGGVSSFLSGLSQAGMGISKFSMAPSRYPATWG